MTGKIAWLRTVDNLTLQVQNIAGAFTVAADTAADKAVSFLIQTAFPTTAATLVSYSSTPFCLVRLAYFYIYSI